MPLARRPAIWADLRRWLLRRLGREQEALESGLSGVPPASQHVHYIDKVRAIRDEITQRIDALVAELDGRR
jgi:hypothetical protein